MKYLRKTLFTLAMVIGLSIAVSAQKNDDQKKPPPKGDPPVVTPQPKNPPPQRPPSTPPKKPGMALWVAEVRNDQSVG